MTRIVCFRRHFARACTRQRVLLGVPLLACTACTLICAFSLISNHSEAVAEFARARQRIYGNTRKVEEPEYRGSLTIRFGGLLGNHMFQYAALYSIARMHHLSPIVEFACSVDIEWIFTLGDGVKFVERELDNDNIETFREIRCRGYDSRVENWNFKERTTLLGECLQSWKYFEKYNLEIRQHFTFVEYIETRVGKILREIDAARGPTTWVGVHVRRGDMVNSNPPYSPPKVGYFRRAMNFFRSKYPDVAFAVCSDDMAWSKKHIKSKQNDTFFMEGNLAYIDLGILARMNHTIMSIGTFGWWGGWLAGGQVVYYKNFVIPKTEQYDFSTFYPPDWIAME